MKRLVNERAESAVIGSMLLRNEEIPRVMQVLDSFDFYQLNHQLIAGLIFEMHSKEQPIDAVTIGSRLGPELKDSMGAVWVLDQILEATPNPMNAVHYAEIVRDLSIRRQVHSVCRKLMRKLPDTTFSVERMLERFHFLVGEINGK